MNVCALFICGNQQKIKTKMFHLSDADIKKPDLTTFGVADLIQNDQGNSDC
jgi:hypothetical protein